MTRILDLQKMDQGDSELVAPGKSTSSANGCACSSNSAALCSAFTEYVAI